MTELTPSKERAIKLDAWSEGYVDGWIDARRGTPYETPNPHLVPAGVSNLTIGSLVKTAHAAAKDKGFWAGPVNFAEKIALIHSELSEALEAHRAGHEPTAEWHQEDGKPEGVPSELADTIIRIADLCGHYGIDLEKAITEKLEYNRARPSKHGKAY